MSVIDRSQLRNRILANLSDEDFSLIANALSLKKCRLAEVLALPGEDVFAILFPETCIISVVVQIPDGSSVEGGLIGLEGFSTSAVMLGTNQTPHRTEVQVAGDGYSISVSDLRAAASKSETLRITLLKFVQALNVQTTYTVMTNALHTVDERLARWLLMCHDRLPSDDIALTHKFMSVMLGIRRASVTVALQTLESNGFIVAERGYVMIRKRAALEAHAGDAYGGPEAEYARLMAKS